MARLLSPTLDVVFKILFADPRNRRLLVSLLEAVLRPAVPIAQVDVTNPEVPRDGIDDKGLVLDLLVDLADGSRVNVEMQTEARTGVRRRALLYWARAYGTQLGTGQDYTKLCPTVSVFFMVERLLRGPRFHSTFRVQEIHDQEVFSPALEIHVVELCKLGAMGGAERGEEGKLVDWGRFLTAKRAEELEDLAMGDPVFGQAKKALEVLSMDPDAQRLAKQRELALWTYRFELGAAREEGEARGEARGRAEGEARGEARGRAEGEARGEARGRASAVLAVLEARHLAVPTPVRERVLDCTDLPTLQRWLARAATCKSADEVVGPRRKRAVAPSRAKGRRMRRGKPTSGR
jgi:predicted transposase/invertase (TIGR01784 family)